MMSLSVYRMAAMRCEYSTLKGTVETRLLHGIIGLCSETGEALEAIADALGTELYGLPVVEMTDDEISLALFASSSRMADFVKKALFYTDRPIDPAKVLYHAGRILSAMRKILAEGGVTLEDLASANIDKLSARHNQDLRGAQ